MKNTMSFGTDNFRNSSITSHIWQ